jgi:hypothetical protein
MGGWESYGGMMLVTDGRKGVNRIGLIIVIPTDPLE